jgi:hypothetical protein
MKIDLKGAFTKLEKAQKVPAMVMKEAVKVFVSNTPSKTGNARRNTSLSDTKINANYGYAQPLDERNHMSTKTIDFIKKEMKRIGK